MLGAVRAGAGDQMQAFSLHTHGQGMTKLATATMTTRIGLTGANAFDVDNRKLYIVVGTEAPAYAPSLFTYDVAANTLTQGVINAENLEIVELGVASDGTLHAVAANMSTSALPQVVSAPSTRRRASSRSARPSARRARRRAASTAAPATSTRRRRSGGA